MLTHVPYRKHNRVYRRLPFLNCITVLLNHDNNFVFAALSCLFRSKRPSMFVPRPRHISALQKSDSHFRGHSVFIRIENFSLLSSSISLAYGKSRIVKELTSKVYSYMSGTNLPRNNTEGSCSFMTSFTPVHLHPFPWTHLSFITTWNWVTLNSNHTFLPMPFSRSFPLFKCII